MPPRWECYCVFKALEVCRVNNLRCVGAVILGLSLLKALSFHHTSTSQGPRSSLGVGISHKKGRQDACSRRTHSLGQQAGAEMCRSPPFPEGPAPCLTGACLAGSLRPPHLPGPPQL